MNGKIKVIDNTFIAGTTKSIFIDGTSQNLHEYLNIENGGLSVTSKYHNKTFLFLGDSITSNGYPILVAKYFNANLINKASSGGDSVRMRNICQGLEGYEKPDYSNIDYVFIMIGHNCDGIYGLANSKLSDIPTDTTNFVDYPNGFYCDVASCIEFIWNEKSSIEIFLITPIQSTNGRYSFTTPLAQVALKEIGNMYALPVIDIYGISGICKRNINTYTTDTIHPNELGRQKIANKIIGQMLSY